MLNKDLSEGQSDQIFLHEQNEEVHTVQTDLKENYSVLVVGHVVEDKLLEDRIIEGHLLQELLL